MAPLAAHATGQQRRPGRPGGWEAEAVITLVHGTAGYRDEHLSHYRDGGS
jgi:hypothetical protein